MSVVAGTPAGKSVAVHIIRARARRTLTVVTSAPPTASEPEPPTGEAPLLERGTAVYPVGYPLAAPWGAPIVPDRVAGVVSDTITFQSAFISSGHSGGALLTEGGDIVGLITSDHPPFGVAVRFERVVELLRRWGYPVHLHAADALHEAIIRGHVDEQRRLVEQCADIVNRRVAVDFGGRSYY